MNLQSIKTNLMMASKTQLAGEIRSKDQKIASLTNINQELNKRLNLLTITRGNLEKEVLKLHERIDQLEKKYWFEFWR